AFQRALAGRFPENRILSHDLLESVYARCGLVSDVTLYEEYPSRYESDAVRRHRWIRGDWQILPWLLPRVPGAEARGIRNPTSAFLPNDAFLSLTAIGRTLWRVFITRRYLLEWVTSGEVARSARTDLAGSYAAMWFAPAIAFASAVSLGVMQPAHRMVTVPFFV